MARKNAVNAEEWRKTNAKETVAGTLRGGWKKAVKLSKPDLPLERLGAVGGKQCLTGGIQKTSDFPTKGPGTFPCVVSLVL